MLHQMNEDLLPACDGPADADGYTRVAGADTEVNCPECLALIHQHDEKVTDWGVVLIPERPNGRMRFVRVIDVDDWDAALCTAEAHNSGWQATQAGPWVEGNSMPLHDTITAKTTDD